MKPKVGILITGRLKSVRLRRKALKHIRERAMFGHMLDRLKMAKLPDVIVLCTSDLDDDDELAEFAESEGINVFRGSPDDVLDRLSNAAKTFELDQVINCMADNPFTDPEMIDDLIVYHSKIDSDYTYVNGLPIGMFSYAMKAEALNKVCQIKDEVDTEIWGGYFTESGIFSCNMMEVNDSNWRAPNLRLTVDTPEDFAMVSAIFEGLDIKKNTISGSSIINYCKENPELIKINSNIVQRSAPEVKLKQDWDSK